MSTQPPLPHQEARLKRNLVSLTLRALLVGIRANVLTVILQPFVLSLGRSVAFLGLLETIGGYRGIVPAIVQPLAGWAADRIGRKGLGVVAGIATVGSLLLYALVGVLAMPALLVPATVLFGLNGVGQPGLEAMVGESAGQARVGHAYSLVTLGWAVAGVFASLSAGYVAGQLGFTPVFASTAALEALGTLLLVFGVHETLQVRHQPRLARPELRRLTVGMFAVRRELGAFYLAVVLDSFFYGLGSALLYGFLAAKFGFTPFQFGLLTTVFSLAWAAAQLPVGHWVDRGLAKEFLVLAEVLNAGAILLWLVASRFEIFVVSMVVLGLVQALWSPAVMAWLYRHVREERRAEELGRLNAVTGLFSFPASYIGGLIYERLGFAAPLVLNLLGTLAAGAILAARVSELPPREAVRAGKPGAWIAIVEALQRRGFWRR